MSDEKRLFLGFEVHAPWPENLPDARTLKASHRHLTLVFIGNTSYKKIRSLIPKMPKPPFRVGPVALSDACLCLPHRDPSVVTWHVDPFGADLLNEYQKEVSDFFQSEGYEMDKRKFLKHITLGRSPFNEKEWKKEFVPLPLYFHHLHLYESFKGLRYEPIWTHDLFPPFEEIEHVADLAFKVYGESLQQIFWNAQIALAFKCSDLLPFLDPGYEVRTIEEGIIRLNEITTEGDKKVGTPFKAVSFHGEVMENKGILTWEMIVDV
ncbi:MAG: hypothetical protein KDK76_02560 [Chlamydiia bacterium]|nr:hypothetical protein [Chlamydiia bacterium]